MDDGYAALGLTPKAIFGRLAAIGAIVLGAAVVFAYTGGWLSARRLTPGRMITALSDRGGNPLGRRRNHSKGFVNRDLMSGPQEVGGHPASHVSQSDKSDFHDDLLFGLRDWRHVDDAKLSAHPFEWYADDAICHCKSAEA
jgi:hypothetical protein